MSSVAAFVGLFGGIGVVRTVTALLGGIILVFGVRAWLATRRNSILLFASGMGVASAGYLLEGLLVEVVGWDLARASLLESVFSLAAFTLLAASLWVRDPRSARQQAGGLAPGTHPTVR